VATGGSFHSFKFLPSIGDFVASMMDGSLPDELAERWAWDRAKLECSNQRMMPAKELADLKAGELLR
jgi:sarcosine oxidase/L-pipecolate oxidase